MQINVSKFMGFLTGIVSILMLGVFGYYMFLVFFTGPKPEEVPSVAAINPAVFGPKIQKAATMVQSKKITLAKKDILFTESPLFKSFTEVPKPVPLSDTRGRPDPFVPYVAP